MRFNNIANFRSPKVPNLIDNSNTYRNLYANIAQRCLASSTTPVNMKFSMMLANPDRSPMRVAALYWIDDELYRQDFVVIRDTVFETVQMESMLGEFTWVILPDGDVLDVSR